MSGQVIPMPVHGGEAHAAPMFSPEAEMSVLGAMIVDPECIPQVAEVLDAGDLYREAHRKLFRAIVTTYETHGRMEMVLLSDRLKSAGDFDAIGGVAYLDELWDFVVSAGNVEYHARIVARHAHRRRVSAGAGEVIAYVRDHPDAAPEELQAEAEKLIGESAPQVASRGNPGFVQVREMLWPAMQAIEQLATVDERELGVRTGLEEVDARLGGMQKGDLIVVAGRPSMGKSGAGVCNLAAHAAIREQRNAALFSIETRRDAVMNRLLGSEARVNMFELRKRRRPLDDEYPRLAEAARLLNVARLHVDHTPGLTLDQMRVKARRLVRDFGPLDLVVVDYLQLMVHPKARSRYDEVSAIGSGLKRFAQEFEVPVVALSQLSRAVEQRPDKRPMMSDLRESGTLEQDADVIILLYRPEYYFGPQMEVRRGKDKFQVTVEGKAEWILAKVREGGTGSAHLGWEAAYTHFDNFGGGR